MAKQVPAAMLVAFFLGCALADTCADGFVPDAALLQLVVANGANSSFINVFEKVEEDKAEDDFANGKKACVSPSSNYPNEPCPGGHSGEITICDGVTQIPMAAFLRCSSITKVSFPEGLRMIGEYAFSYCSSLTQVSFGNGIKNIYTGAFASTALTGDVYLPVEEGSVTVDSSAFPGGVTLKYLDPTLSPTQSPTPAPTPSPTSSPTEDATSAPMEVANHGVSGGLSGVPIKAVGDPHMTNIHGERFEIMQPGAYVLLQIPKGATHANSLLQVEAEVKQSGEACTDMYIQTLMITGAWVESVHKGGLIYRSGEAGMPWQTLGRVDIKVAPGITSGGVVYLNVFVKRLSSVGCLVGGLLGEDDHTAAATPLPSCEKAILSLLEPTQTS